MAVEQRARRCRNGALVLLPGVIQDAGGSRHDLRPVFPPLFHVGPEVPSCSRRAPRPGHPAKWLSLRTKPLPPSSAPVRPRSVRRDPLVPPPQGAQFLRPSRGRPATPARSSAEGAVPRGSKRPRCRSTPAAAGRAKARRSASPAEIGSSNASRGKSRISWSSSFSGMAATLAARVTRKSCPTSRRPSVTTHATAGSSTPSSTAKISCPPERSGSPRRNRTGRRAECSRGDNRPRLRACRNPASSTVRTGSAGIQLWISGTRAADTGWTVPLCARSRKPSAAARRTCTDGSSSQ